MLNIEKEMGEWRSGEKSDREILETLLLRSRHIHTEVKALNAELIVLTAGLSAVISERPFDKGRKS